MMHPVDFHLHTNVRLLVTSWYCWVVALDSVAAASFSSQITMHGGYLVFVCVCVCVFVYVCSFSWFIIFYLYK
jgi:hypothetical protein